MTYEISRNNLTDICGYFSNKAFTRVQYVLRCLCDDMLPCSHHHQIHQFSQIARDKEREEVN